MAADKDERRLDALFYTFLGVFICTAGITLLGVVGALNVKDEYLKWLLGSVIVESCAAIIALFFKLFGLKESRPDPRQGVTLSPELGPKKAKTPRKKLVAK